ncbi:MAG: hypothetical protein JSS66_18935 [Armatimonadetes bacterium]|nr:hypothetical protein [Armatimonadota bacterium]
MRKWIAPLAMALACMAAPAFAQSPVWTRSNIGVSRNTSPFQIGVDAGTGATSFVKMGTVVGGQYVVPSASITGGLGYTPLNKAGDLMQPSGVITGSSPSPVLTITATDTAATGSNFFLNSAIVANTIGTGNREGLHVEQNSTANTVGYFVVGINGIGHLRGGSGNVFGVNGYAWTDSGTSATAEVVGAEMDTDVRNASVIRKVGLQVSDIATSVGTGSVHDAAILVENQPGAIGYNSGLQFGGSTAPIRSNLITAATAGVVAGVDFNNVTFSAFPWRSKSFQFTDAGAFDIGNRSSAGAASLNFHSNGSANFDTQISSSGGSGSPYGGVLSFGATSFQFSVGKVVANAGLATTTLQTSTPRTVTASTDSATASDAAIIFNGSGTITETLPSASANSGRIILVKTIAAQAVNSASSNVVPIGSATAATAILAATAGKWAYLMSDGTNWVVMAAN